MFSAPHFPTGGSVMRRTGLFTLVMLVAAIAPIASAQTFAARFDGRPEFKEGKAYGYFIWRDGDTWKLRWTTFGAEHRFNGRIVLEGGEIKSFKRIDVDEERKVIRPGYAPRVVRGPAGRVRGVRPGRAPVVAERTEDKIEQEDERTLLWLTRTNDDIDGVDFKVTESTVVIRFNLMIDGEAKPAEVEVGKENFKPNENPVRARLKP
jgi:hypothetical protein